MDPVYALIAIVVLIATIWAVRYERLRRAALQAYWDRQCQGRGWKSAFPDSKAADIRAFLSLFVDCFGFKASNQLKFSPSDELLAIYRASNPDRTAPDVLEMETFGHDLKMVYGLDLADFWHDRITLGDVYSRITNAA